MRVIENEWKTVCDKANLSPVDRAMLWRRQFLNPFAFWGVSKEVLWLRMAKFRISVMGQAGAN